jgi:hypothetical protein
MSSYSQNIYRKLRELVPAFSQDTVMNEKTFLVRDYIKNNHLSMNNITPIFADYDVDVNLGSEFKDEFEVAVV